MFKRIKCFFGYHEWGNPENIREKSFDETWVALLLFTPIFFLFQLIGMPKECDKRCINCKKVKVFNI